MKPSIQKLSLAAVLGLFFSPAGLFAQYTQQMFPYPHNTSLDGFPISGDAITARSQFMSAGFLESRSREELQMESPAATSANGNVNGAAVNTPGLNNPSVGSPGGTGNSGAGVGSLDESRGSFDITPEFSAFSNPQLKGSVYTLPLYATYKLTDRISLSLNVPITYTDFRIPGSVGGGSLDVWNPDVTIGLPIKLIKKSKDLPLSWTVTPHGGAGGYFANDTTSSYTYVGHGGVTSMLGYETKYFSISMANQITCFETITRSGSYQFAGVVDQQLLKNGLKLSVPFCARWVADLYAIDTEYLEHALLTRYQTVGASIGYHRPSMKKGAYIKIGTYTEFGAAFQSLTAQVGTGWKF